MLNTRNTRDIIQALSVLPQADAGSLYVPRNSADYLRFLSNETPPQVPNPRRVRNNMVGNGRRFPKKAKNYYFDSRTFNYAGLLNDQISTILYARDLGGLITATPRTGGVKDYAILQNVINSNPKLSSLVRYNGAEQMIQGDYAVNTIDITQEAEAQPTFGAGLVNTGHFIELPDAVADVQAFVNGIPNAPEYKTFDGAYTSFTFSDGVNPVYDLPAEGRLLSLGINITQNIYVKALPGDKAIDPANRCKGAFARTILILTQTASMRIKAFMGADFKEFKAMLANNQLNSVTAKFVSCENYAGTTDTPEFEVKFPLASFETIEGDTEDQFQAINMTITADEDTVTGGLVTGRVRTNATVA